MTRNYPADPEWEDTPTDNEETREYLQEGEHTCKVTQCKVVFSEKQGEDFLVVEVEDIHDQRFGTIWQSFASDRLMWLKKVADLLLDPPCKGREELRARAGEAVGTVVLVKTVTKGQYTNHYINSVVKRPESAEVSNDDIPF